MFNLYGQILTNPARYRQLQCGESLISYYNCPLENKFVDLWSHHNYIVYVVEGRKIWHTSHGSFDLQKGNCVFVRKGASIVEQFFDVRFCLIIFFLPDDFISDTLKQKTKPIPAGNTRFDPVIQINASTPVHAFFNSMLPYFDTGSQADQSLLELKFRELIFILANEEGNTELHSFFNSIVDSAGGITMQQIMEENFMFNLKLEEFARLCSKSLSAFKRDFQKLFQTTPGKWLMEKRLDHAKHLLEHSNKTVSEAAFESGFENASHFSRAFRTKFKAAPLSYRQQVA